MSSWAMIKILQNLLFILYIVLRCATHAAEIHVSGYERSAVNVSCSYDQGYESYEKYLCRNDCGGSDVLITTSETKKNKYSINDDKKTKTFTVTISDLKYNDAGKYKCGVTRWGKDIYTDVKVGVFPDSCCDRVTKIQSHDGGSVSIICPYESWYQDQLKFLCRGNQPSTCLQQAVVTSDRKHSTQFTLTDDRKSQFTVNITNLTHKDSGFYLCGIHRNTGLDVFSAVELEVKERCCVTISTVEPETPTTHSTTHNHTSGVTDLTHLVYILPATLTPLLIITLILVIIFKNKVCKSQGVSRRERTFNHIYENHTAVVRLKPKQKSTRCHDDAHEDPPDYENVTLKEEIYCNQHFHEGSK